mmetsp:Transcript_16672/g.51203  ORF Transcript_16672/g.51203 Transcript_16672/m.51203 type:complete len:290 (-) Transcript_16672:1426-2295(-)
MVPRLGGQLAAVGVAVGVRRRDLSVLLREVRHAQADAVAAARQSVDRRGARELLARHALEARAAGADAELVVAPARPGALHHARVRHLVRRGLLEPREALGAPSHRAVRAEEGVEAVARVVAEAVALVVADGVDAPGALVDVGDGAPDGRRLLPAALSQRARGAVAVAARPLLLVGSVRGAEAVAGARVEVALPVVGAEGVLLGALRRVHGHGLQRAAVIDRVQQEELVHVAVGELIARRRRRRDEVDRGRRGAGGVAEARSGHGDADGGAGPKVVVRAERRHGFERCL